MAGKQKPNRIMTRAYDIAKKSLRACYAERGIFAGTGHFDDYWARDSFFASLGALELGDIKVVKKNLDLFLEFMRPNGQLPLRIGAYNLMWKMLTKKADTKIKRIKDYIFFSGPELANPVKSFKVNIKELNARYLNDRNKNFPVDVNSLFLVSAYYYLKKTKDKSFGIENFANFQKILNRNFRLNKKHDILLENHPGSSWDDSLNIMGESIYTNVCHCAAVRSMAKISKLIGDKAAATRYELIFKRVKDRINKKFWNGEYYSNFITKGKQYNVFSTAGNILAIHWHIASKKKAQSIEKKITEYGINDNVPSLTNYPKYPSNFVYLPFYFLGTYDYHNMGMSWLWLGAEDTIVKQKIGLHKEAFKTFEKMSNLIVKHNGVYEVYEQNGNPVHRFLYQSEVPFAWSSALFVTAYHALFEPKKSILQWELPNEVKK